MRRLVFFVGTWLCFFATGNLWGFSDGRDAFKHLHRVATHPRCVNCHGHIENGEHVPTVGDNLAAHPMNVKSRITSLGHACTSCHQRVNMDPPLPPGASNNVMPDFLWHMPAPSMILRTNLTPRELCELWLDPNRNSTTPGGRGSIQDLATFRKEFMHHVSDDPLIHWTFAPGKGRTAAPGNRELLVQAMDQWITWLEQGNTCANL